MSFEKLKQSILEQARKKADDVAAALDAKVQAEEQRISDKARAMEEVIIREAEKEGIREARRHRQEVELKGRAAVLTAKQEELDATKEAFRQQLLQLPQAETDRLLSGLLQLVPQTSGTLVPGSVHADRLKHVAGDTFTIAKTPLPDEGGFVYQSEKAEVDLTISRLVDQLFMKHRSAIAEVLFR